RGRLFRQRRSCLSMISHRLYGR
ncbi:hypothetical protein D047_2749B, partial [Vibrio parahaemolyticus VPTS-2010_2]